MSGASLPGGAMPPGTAPPTPPPAPRASLIGPIILIAIGVLFLYANTRPGMHPSQIFWRYWPALLIVWGLAKLWQWHEWRSDPQGPRPRFLSGGEIALLFILILVGAGLSFRPYTGPRSQVHEQQAVELQGAERVRVKLDMGAGELRIEGGAAKLLEATFDYNIPDLKPRINYSVAAGQGSLTIYEPEHGVSIGPTNNTWELRLNSQTPLELDINMGAGESNLRLGGMQLSRLALNLGAGNATVDLTGQWKKDLEADLHGGVGNGVIRLPRDAGVRVSAHGGIGNIDAGGGLRQQGGYYVNDAYGRSPVTLRINVEGGVGNIRLE